jgi:hypothetical protein
MSKRYTGFLPTAQARDWKGPQGRAYRGEAMDLPAILYAPPASPPSISSAAGHLANLQVSPGSEEAQRMCVGSGRRLLGLYGNCGLLGACLRTLLEYLVSTTAFRSRLCYLTWKVKATKFNRLLFQLAPSVPRTGETGCGLLLTTPNSQDGRDVPDALRPSRIATGRKTDYLSRQIAMLPTPATRDYKGARKPETLALTGRNPDTNSLEDCLVGKNTGMKLQPAFVEWMMGYPDGWTELTD